MFHAHVVGSMALVVMLLIGAAAAVAQANGDAMPDAGFNHGGSATGAVHRKFGDPSSLLPCPRSVPCLTTGGNADGKAQAPTVRTVALLPCPFSVPCFTTGQNIDLPASPAQSGIHPAARRSRQAKTKRVSLRDDRTTNRRRNTAMAKGPGRITELDIGGESRNPAPPRRSGVASGEIALRGDATYELRARTLLSEVERKLGRLDRARLDANRAQVYAKANDFTQEGYRALRANDNLAAMGFAEKAQLLSAVLDTAKASTPSQR